MDDKWTNEALNEFMLTSFIPPRFHEHKKNLRKAKTELEKLKCLKHWDVDDIREVIAEVDERQTLLGLLSNPSKSVRLIKETDGSREEHGFLLEGSGSQGDGIGVEVGNSVVTTGVGMYLIQTYSPEDWRSSL